MKTNRSLSLLLFAGAFLLTGGLSPVWAIGTSSMDEGNGEALLSAPEAVPGMTYLEALEAVAKTNGLVFAPVLDSGSNWVSRLRKPYKKPELDPKKDGGLGGLVKKMLADAQAGSFDKGITYFIPYFKSDDERVFSGLEPTLYVGPGPDLLALEKNYSAMELKCNTTKIHFVSEEDQKTVYEAVLEIGRSARVSIIPNRMDEKDKKIGLPPPKEIGRDTVAANAGKTKAKEGAAKSKESSSKEEDEEDSSAEGAAKTDAARGEAASAADMEEDLAGMTAKAENQPRRTTFTTANAPGGVMPWRDVLTAVLDPHYTFDEDEKPGFVVILTQSEASKLASARLEAAPMEVRYVPVHHANPEDIVEKLGKLAVMRHPKASIMVAPYQEKAPKVTDSYRRTLSSSSSSLSTGNTTIGDSSSSSSGSWGNLLRPKVPPAILVQDVSENLDAIEDLIRSLDVREKQVLIEAMILSLSDDGSRKLGMKMDSLGFDNLEVFGVSFKNDYNNGHKSSSKDTWSSKDDRSSTASRTISRSGGEQWTKSETSGELGNRKENYWTSESSVALRDAFAGSSTRENSSSRNRAFSSVLGPLDFKFVLEMVEEEGNGKVLSSPVVTIGDHSEAMVHVGYVEPIAQLRTTIVAGGVNNAVAENVEWYELVTGIMMWVGPEVTDDGKSIRLWVHPKLSKTHGTPVHISVNGSDFSYPRLQSEELDTRVTVPSGSTLLLGGLVDTATSEVIKKIPILGDIPLLGRLFRWTSTESERRNLVILIRPTVLDDDAPVTGFEDPAMKIVDPMMQGSGRTLVDVAFTDEKDPMKRREKAILKAVGLGKDDSSAAEEEPSVVVTTTVSPADVGTQDAPPSAVQQVPAAAPAVAPASTEPSGAPAVSEAAPVAAATSAETSADSPATQSEPPASGAAPEGGEVAKDDLADSTGANAEDGAKGDEAVSASDFLNE